MKFSDINKDDWVRLQPYLDTCLLPVTGISGSEEPWEITKSLEQLRDLMDLLEIPFKGRVVTFPAVHYLAPNPEMAEHIDRLCREIKNGGMTYIVLVTAKREVAALDSAEADLMIGPASQGESIGLHKASIAEQIVNMWKKKLKG